MGPISPLILALGLFAASAAQADCPPDAPTGLYQGTADSADTGKVDATLDLVCDKGVYQARLFTGMGEFKVNDLQSVGGKVRFGIDTQASLGSVELALTARGLSGRVSIGELAIPIDFARIGEAQPVAAMDPRLDLTPVQWREDLKALAQGLATKHANAFFSLPRAEFDAAVADLDRHIPQLNPDQIFIGMQRIANMIGDGHTGLVFPPDRRSFPIELTRFGDSFRVTGVGPGLEPALGAKVVSIGGTPIAKAHALALTITPRGELDALREGRVPYYLSRGMALHGLGVIPDRDRAIYGLRGEDGRSFEIEAKGLAADQTVALKPAAAAKPLWLQRADESFWCAELAEARTVYCAWRAYQDLKAKAAAMFALVDKAHPDRLVIDMRDNGGGDNTVGEAELVRPIAARADLNRRGRVYVLVGPLTFSAAMNNAAQFADDTQAILVGQTIGEKPNSYQEPRQFLLPNSHLLVRASTRYYAFRKTGENAVRPDKEIEPGWADVKAGRDPVLDWVMAQPPAG